MENPLAAIVDQIRQYLPDAMLRDRLEAEDVLQRWLPPRHPEKILPRLEQLALHLMASAEKRAERAKSTPTPTFPEGLPITARAEEITKLLQEHPVLVIAGETGSGKTTQLPKMCLAAGFGVAGAIACTQPRRVAALSVSQRIAEELKVPFGREVGAKIRFTDQTSDQTRIKLLTDGMLLSEIQGDPLLRDYEVVIVDEAHERSLNIDFLLGYLKRVRVQRPDLKIIVTSATIDTATFSRHFDDAPIIEVSGRTFPVEVRYAPVDEVLQDRGETSYLDAAAQVIDDLTSDNREGDVLTFLPSEKDIRELRKLLEDRNLSRVEVLPLFGRLTNEEQQRIFQSSRRRKIILATNIAETSLTIPGISYVVDSGLARISRYSAHTRTQRLPIEPVAQSSAEQRKGRAGRVSEGVCIRLYSEADFLARPQYATPEIQRANLAAVILRMLAFGLGQVEDFPFIDPPQERAIRAGYQLLQDLGALDHDQRLTPLGRQLARLPADPTVGRMLLAAQKEGSLTEVLVIAAGLSIQDPRERPMDAREAADQQHRKFTDPKSDFLTLLNLWNAYHDQTEKLTQKQLRKFCQEHFLNYMRMREWRDIHQQLSQILKEIKEFRPNAAAAEYHQIHRALLTGLLGNVGHRDENNHYRAPHQRTVMLFPGSALFDKKAAKAERKKGQPKPKEGGGKARTPEWIVCAEWVETNRLYGRTCAEIQPAWILELGAHLCSRQYSEPYYEASSERVLCKERVRLYGLEVATNRVQYLRVNPVETTDIFIRQALVDGQLKTNLPFFTHNQELREKVTNLQTRRRHASAWTLDERVYQFYASRLQGVGSVPDLRRLAKDRAEPGQNDIWSFLCLSEADLLEDAGEDDSHLFPDQVEMNGARLDLSYQYQPGTEVDGATLKVSIAELDAIDPARLDWMVPGYLEEKVQHLLRSLPKETRVKLHPIGNKAKELTGRLSPQPETLISSLTRLIADEYGVHIWPDEWNLEAIPEHLRPRVEVVDNKGQTVAAGRDWDTVARQYEEQARANQEKGGDLRRRQLWRKGAQRYEIAPLTEANYPSLPLEVQLAPPSELPVLAYPGLKAEPKGVAVRLFESPEQAAKFTHPAFRRFALGLVGRDLGWVERDLERELRRVAKVPQAQPKPPIQKTKGGTSSLDFSAKLEAAASRLNAQQRHLPTAVEELLPAARAHLHEALFIDAEPLPLDPKQLQRALETAKQRVRGWPQAYVDQLEEIYRWHGAVVRESTGAPAWLHEGLDRLVAPDFLRRTSVDRLPHLPRYLAALYRRWERAKVDPIKDAEKARRLAPFERQLNALRRETPARQRLFWLLEEYRIQVFAQEVGTAERVSEVILSQAATAAQQADNPEPGPVQAPEDPQVAEARREAKQKRPATFQSVDELRRALGAR
ncbi:MAG: ATP-dependent RNA helicase HrpA [Verrucomicrobiota bacterium JB022]|nr:ATP-dependent RNA helicase HrpA [Verrucomicrobiota bacterium JB022]